MACRGRTNDLRKFLTLERSASHQKAIHIGYADGHIARVKLKDLWIQIWHQGFIPNRNVKLPPGGG